MDTPAFAQNVDAGQKVAVAQHEEEEEEEEEEEGSSQKPSTANACTHTHNTHTHTHNRTKQKEKQNQIKLSENEAPGATYTMMRHTKWTVVETNMLMGRTRPMWVVIVGTVGSWYTSSAVRYKAE